MSTITITAYLSEHSRIIVPSSNSPLGSVNENFQSYSVSNSVKFRTEFRCSPPCGRNSKKYPQTSQLQTQQLWRLKKKSLDLCWMLYICSEDHTHFLTSYEGAVRIDRYPWENSLQVVGWLNWLVLLQFSSVTQSSRLLWPHGLQHARLPCPSPIFDHSWYVSVSVFLRLSLEGMI